MTTSHRNSRSLYCARSLTLTFCFSYFVPANSSHGLDDIHVLMALSNKSTIIVTIAYIDDNFLSFGQLWSCAVRHSIMACDTRRQILVATENCA